MKRKNPIDQILDPNDNDPVTLYDDDDNAMDFEQICLVPIGKQIFTILKPLAQIDGIKDDEALVFQLYTDEERKDSLILVTEKNLVEKVFKVYYDLFEQNKKNTQ